MPANVIWNGSVVLNEQANSPEWNFSDRASCVRTYKGPYGLCKSSAPYWGVLGTGEQLGMWVVESGVTKEKGGIGTLRIKYEGPLAGPLPPNEAGIEPEKDDRPLYLHPRYATVSDDLKKDVNTALETSKEDSDSVAALARVNANTLAAELYSKMRSGLVSYRIFVPVYKLLIYSWTAPGGLTMGGFRQNPPNVPIVAPTGDWVREADRVGVNASGIWQVERRWQGAPNLDPVIYP